jgi:hypothetical protein
MHRSGTDASHVADRSGSAAIDVHGSTQDQRMGLSRLTPLEVCRKLAGRPAASRSPRSCQVCNLHNPEPLTVGTIDV